MSEADSEPGSVPVWPSLLIGSVLLTGLVVWRRSAALMLLLAASVVLTGTAVADDAEGEPNPNVPVDSIKGVEKLDNIELIDLLADPKKAEAAAEAIVKRGEKIVPDLIGEAEEGNDMALRGWAIVCISEIGGEEATKRLTEIHQNGEQPMLVRTWSAAALVHMTNDTDQLVKYAEMIPTYPALGRPIGKKIVAKLAQDGNDLDATDLLVVSMKVPQLQQSLAPAILNLGAPSLIDAMSTAEDQNVRRQAAGYLATLGQQDAKAVADAVVDAYKFDPKAKAEPWAGGPLFIPGIQWPKEPAKDLTTALVAWHLWANINKKPEVQTPIHNNLRSLNLASAAGYQSPGFQQVDTLRWLQIYKSAYGNDAVEALLKEQQVADKAPYKDLID